MIVCNPQRFYIDYRNVYEYRTLLFFNSLGGIEVIRMIGRQQAKSEYERVNASVIQMPESMADAVLSAQRITVDAIARETFTGDTGFIAKDNLERLRDLFLASADRRIYEYKDDRLIPLIITSNSTVWYASDQQLYSLSLEWQYAFDEKNYAPAGLLNPLSACPPVSFFTAVQSGKDRITVTWALHEGYNKILIAIGDLSYTLDGNSGQQELFFENPATSSTGALVTITARTICNPAQDPPDLGAVTTLSRRVYPNEAPVAIGDTFFLQSGFTSPQVLPGSVLDNDYDPNGDELKVIAASGSTDESGTYSINSAGVVTYTPPSAEFTGVDYFRYTLSEVGDNALTATGQVAIKVQASVTHNSTIYVRLSYRNKTKGVKDMRHVYFQQVFLEFFSDSLATIPLDVTGMGFNVRVRKTRKDNTTTYEDSSIQVSGFEMKIFDGQYISRYIFEIEWRLEWSIIPGIGYMAI